MFFPRRHIPLPLFTFLHVSSLVYNIGWNHSKYSFLNHPPPSFTLIWSVSFVKFIFVFLLISSPHNKAFIIFHLAYCSNFLTDFLATNLSSFPLPDLFFSVHSIHVWKVFHFPLPEQQQSRFLRTSLLFPASLFSTEIFISLWFLLMLTSLHFSSSFFLLSKLSYTVNGQLKHLILFSAFPEPVQSKLIACSSCLVASFIF